MKAKLSIQLESFQGDFEITDNAADFISHKIGAFGLNKSSVYSLCFNLEEDDNVFNRHTKEVFVSENLRMLRSFVDAYFDSYEDLGIIQCDFQEWDSYDSAYEMALIVREGNPLHSI